MEVLSKGLVTSAWQDYHFALEHPCRRDDRLAQYRAAAKQRQVQDWVQGEGRTNLKCGLVRCLDDSRIYFGFDTAMIFLPQARRYVHPR